MISQHRLFRYIKFFVPDKSNCYQSVATTLIDGMRSKSTARMSTAGSARTIRAIQPTKSCAVECGGFTYLVGVTKGKKSRA